MRPHHLAGARGADRTAADRARSAPSRLGMNGDAVYLSWLAVFMAQRAV